MSMVVLSEAVPPKEFPKYSALTAAGKSWGRKIGAQRKFRLILPGPILGVHLKILSRMRGEKKQKSRAKFCHDSHTLPRLNE